VSSRITPSRITPSRITPSRITLSALAADVVAVVVFAAVGRASHAEPGDLVGLLATAAPFLAGLLIAWALPGVRRAPVTLRTGGIVAAVTVVVGLALRFAVTGRLPLTFVLVTALSLAVLLLGWRALAALVARRTVRR
jgi:hypothetical protein